MKLRTNSDIGAPMCAKSKSISPVNCRVTGSSRMFMASGHGQYVPSTRVVDGTRAEVLTEIAVHKRRSILRDMSEYPV